MDPLPSSSQVQSLCQQRSSRRHHSTPQGSDKNKLHSPASESLSSTRNGAKVFGSVTEGDRLRATVTTVSTIVTRTKVKRFMYFQMYEGGRLLRILSYSLLNLLGIDFKLLPIAFDNPCISKLVSHLYLSQPHEVLDKRSRDFSCV
jgi:hypothetical protein